jgi:hypothetical protein
MMPTDALWFHPATSPSLVQQLLGRRLASALSHLQLSISSRVVGLVDPSSATLQDQPTIVHTARLGHVYVIVCHVRQIASHSFYVRLACRVSNSQRLLLVYVRWKIVF